MLEILHEDNCIIVCIKPAGIDAQAEHENAMPAMLAAQLRCRQVFAVHRLDQVSSGVMVYAKTKDAAAKLSDAMQKGAFDKQYLACVHGEVKPDSGELRDFLFFDRRTRKSYTAKKKRAGVREAVLDYEVVQGLQDKTLVRIKLHTGRTHQIRVQFASRKHPLLGDGKYGSSDNGCTCALFCAKLSFPHPSDGNIVTFSAQPPAAYPWNLFAYK